MSFLKLPLQQLVESYKEWVSKNPQIASEYETTAKWISYFIAGRINNSHVVSELVYCLSNLLVLLNDQIILKKLKPEVATSPEKVKLWLAIIEYSEVFCELSAEKLGGTRQKWIVIVAIQVYKCIARSLLIYKHKENIIENPPIPPLDRSKFSKDGKLREDDLKDILNLNKGDLNAVSFTLKRSGRLVRRIESSPPLALRNWKPVEFNETGNDASTKSEESEEGALVKQKLIAETLYIVKPLVHLVSLRVFGTKTWKPWLIALALDITSLQLYTSTKKKYTNALSKKQRLQLSKRTVLLLLYLIRSPVYEKYSENKINGFLNALSSNVPLVRLICTPLMQYLPFWQSSYFYMWST